MINNRIEKYNIHGGSKREQAGLEYLSENRENIKIMENNILRGF
jgi:hypothetical protein